MYAHINIWRLTDAGASPDNTIAHEVARRLRDQPGFRSYTLVRTDVREVVAVIVFDSAERLDAALRTLTDLVHERLVPLAAGAPQRRRGEVLYHATA